MRDFIFSFFIISAMACNNSPVEPIIINSNSPKLTKPNPILVIHGGAGYMTTENLNDSLQVEYHFALNIALQIGNEILQNGGQAIEAVEKTINYLENNPLFNAGKGSVLNSKGEVENDASIMDGTTLACGAVAGVQNVKNPISLARLVKDSTHHVMLSGIGAFQFAKLMNLEIVDQEYFMTDKRRKQREEMIKKTQKMGTVGCVALDAYGNIAAGTSTGGMMGKKWGRIGDSPIIGAGTYANSEVAGVSCTGHGEFFIKNAVAYDVIARIEYSNATLQESCDDLVLRKLKKQEANGGLIAIDSKGNYSFSFNTPGMFRGVISSDTTYTAIFK